jgi:hypothetical protein
VEFWQCEEVESGKSLHRHCQTHVISLHVSV